PQQRLGLVAADASVEDDGVELVVVETVLCEDAVLGAFDPAFEGGAALVGFESVELATSPRDGDVVVAGLPHHAGQVRVRGRVVGVDDVVGPHVSDPADPLAEEAPLVEGGGFERRAELLTAAVAGAGGQRLPGGGEPPEDRKRTRL